MTDSHCHLAGEEFAGDLEAVVDRARAAGVSRALVILAAEDAAETARAATVLDAWPECRFAVGVHPHQARVFAGDPQAAAGAVAARLDALPEARAIGEIGLDYHYDFSPRDVQHEVFRAQIRLALERDLPVVIHTREAEEDTLRILGEEGRGRLRGVFHCFTGDPAAAARALATGFYLSIPGVMTFPKAESLRQAAASCSTTFARYAGSFRLPRKGTGARYGLSVSTSSRSAGAAAAACRRDSALGKVITPGIER
jgi:TatD DNase family protein